MQASQSNRSTELRDYLSVLNRRKWTVLLVTLIVVATAVFLSYQQTERYTASARLLIDPSSFEDTDSPLRSVDVTTETHVIDSEAIASIVRDDLGIDTSVEDILAETEANAVAETRVIEVTYTSTNATEARDVAQGLAESYIDFRRDRELERLRTAEESIQERIDSVNDQLEQLTTRIRRATRAGSDTLVTQLEAQRNILLARLGVLQERLDELQPSDPSQLDVAEIIESAKTPDSPSSPSYPRNTALAIFLGLALGTGLGFMRERLDDRFRTAEDVERALKVPVLGTVPRFPRANRRGAARLVTHLDPEAMVSEFYRGLRTNVDVATSQRNLKTLLVTSPSDADGKSVTCANLAVALAQAGRRVTLVSGDLRTPQLGTLFDVEGRAGLATWLKDGDADVERLLMDPGIANLRLVPSGPLPSRPGELLATPRLEELVRGLAARSDYVIFDSPPSFPVADATVYASRLDATILVIDIAKTSRSSALRATEQLERAGGVILGVVLNSYEPEA